MSTDSDVYWVLARGRRIRPYLYASEAAAVRALGVPGEDSAGSEVERQRRDGWVPMRVRVTPDQCGLCGEAWVVGHECKREEP